MRVLPSWDRPEPPLTCYCLTDTLAAWLAAATINAFGLVELREVGENGQNVAYVATLVLMSVSQSYSHHPLLVIR